MEKKKQEKEKQEKLSPKEFIKTVGWIFKTYYEISPSKTILLLITRILRDLRGLIYGVFFAKIIDQLIMVASSEAKDFRLMIPYLVALLLYYIFVSGLIGNIYQYSYRGLRQISRSRLEIIFAQQLNYLGVQNLENPDILNRINRASQWLQDTFMVLNDTVVFISNIVQVIVSGVVIFSFFPVMIPVLLGSMIIRFFPDQYFMKKDFHWQVDNSEKRRIAWSSIGAVQNASSLQEISIVGGYEFFKKKFDDCFTWFNNGMLKIFKEREVTNFFLSALDSIIGVVGYGVVFYNFVHGKFTMGTASFQMRALDTFAGSLDSMLASITFMNEFSVKMKDLIALFEMKPAVEDGNIKLPYLDTPPEIEFRNVSFKYPKAKKYVFKNLSFKIDSGEEVALVGHNGAGKTTIVKLLARIYSVTSGAILINGININDLSIDDWYKNLGVLFQEFNFYSHLSVKENIITGKPKEKVDEKKVIEAAKNADAHEFIMEYKNKYDQIMTEKVEGGIRPSSGQAQKIAIARFFYRNAPLAIFDEPTAAIDAVSEYKIFNRIYDFFDNKTVIIISHRFSTVRNADRIIVLDKGKVVEEGTHEELVKKDGIYSKSYKLQAEGYK
ncbi:TPA: ABC transporter ATP-binding protein [Candidatus Dojkabacteria bacterium]|uniref:ABC transporter ATP-binding protein n=1 Tax=Candidatus Dojkabacteria bacterium TaxID=2099670 RepID=A0A832R8I3_9BACT|nr:ABC transporter ATP-binding protein [Candidatus Dojkabacteria bacterium]